MIVTSRQLQNAIDALPNPNTIDCPDEWHCLVMQPIDPLQTSVVCEKISDNSLYFKRRLFSDGYKWIISL